MSSAPPKLVVMERPESLLTQTNLLSTTKDYGQTNKQQKTEQNQTTSQTNRNNTTPLVCPVVKPGYIG